MIFENEIDVAEDIHLSAIRLLEKNALPGIFLSSTKIPSLYWNGAIHPARREHLVFSALNQIKSLGWDVLHTAGDYEEPSTIGIFRHGEWVREIVVGEDWITPLLRAYEAGLDRWTTQAGTQI